MVDELNKKKNEVDEELRLHKRDLDDLKAGRIDKIKERQEKDEKAREISPIKITLVEINNYQPQKPWYNPYEIVWRGWTVNNSPIYCGDGIGGSFTTTTSDTNDNSLTIVTAGYSASNFVGGAYSVNDHIVNL